jgi:hypothetical protein
MTPHPSPRSIGGTPDASETRQTYPESIAIKTNRGGVVT